MLKGLSLAALFFTSLTASANTARWQDPQYIESSFFTIALHNEYDAHGKKIRKWDQPIKVFLDHRVPDQDLHTELARMHIEHLANLSNHDISLVDTLDESNVHWVYTRQSEWEGVVEEVMGKPSVEHTRSALCMANFAVNSRGELVRANIVIPVDQARDHGKLLACVVEEMTQILGLPNDSDSVYPSVFNDRSPEDLLSPLDGLLIKLLYHPSIKAGMTEAQARPLIKELLMQFTFDGTIDNIHREVIEGELYEAMGFR
ncbi:DUF2927 domain-containing protein [Vibrio sp. SCSIO 43136]|uniref:DUF2927 domain-containing protein n=1 Tax=Vibrio sp. SCSIO 43136 TaxID=2819101 RepID=UPI002075C595|nr:DUF2927 domain-containing protein [Vibrio sp. SCSIO 43136]USD66294.1 DUF2927 domain-containing protein [Vibrio sp. SCSIO 43136]